MNSPISHLVNYQSSLQNVEKKAFVPTDSDISSSLYADLCELHYAGWKSKINIRKKRANISDEFEDLLSWYLRSYLPDEFRVEQTLTKDNVTPDILILDRDNPIFIIEVKTTIGWDREGPTNSFPKRIQVLSKVFNIPEKNIIFVFENHNNNGVDFSKLYWDKKTQSPKEPPMHFPYSQIKPFFNKPDPYYWKYERGFKKDFEFKNFVRQDFINLAKQNTITKFEDILIQIIQSTQNLQQ